MAELLGNRMGLWGTRGGRLVPVWALIRGVLMPPWPIHAPRMGTPPRLWLCCRGIFFQSLGHFHPPRSRWGNTGLWDGVTLKDNLADPTSLHRPSLAMHLTSSQCSCLMHSSCCLWGVHWEQLQALPCKLVLLPSGFLHQGTPKGSTWRGVQRPTQVPLVLILRSAFDTLSFTWWPHYGTGTLTWTGPILDFWW